GAVDHEHQPVDRDARQRNKDNQRDQRTGHPAHGSPPSRHATGPNRIASPFGSVMTSGASAATPKSSASAAVPAGSGSAISNQIMPIRPSWSSAGRVRLPQVFTATWW